MIDINMFVCCTAFIKSIFQSRNEQFIAEFRELTLKEKAFRLVAVVYDIYVLIPNDVPCFSYHYPLAISICSSKTSRHPSFVNAFNLIRFIPRTLSLKANVVVFLSETIGKASSTSQRTNSG